MFNNSFPYSLDNKRYHTLNYELKKKFGCRVWKAAIDGGFTCPNIDGKKGIGGCIFCDNGSGYFVHEKYNIKQQIELETNRIHQKYPNGKIIVYFQKNTNTYAEIDVLKNIFYQAIEMPYVVGLSIATRADCLSGETVNLLAELSKKTYLTVELGMQTANDKTNEFCNRGYNHSEFKDGFFKLKNAGIRTCIHIIDGLPFETEEDMLNTADEVNRLHPDAVKIQLLHVIKGTQLEKFYNENIFRTLEKDEYIKIAVKQLQRISADIVIERITGDGDKNKLISPLWSLNKKSVIAGIDKYMAENDLYQGKI